MILWDRCRKDFEPDGALRDIYVHGTTIAQWRAVFDVLRANCALEYSVDGSLQPVPATVEAVFSLRGTASASLHFRVGGILVACHFFTTEEIEFDVSPREINSQATLDELLGFMRLIGDLLDRPVVMSHENDALHPFLTYEPGSRKFVMHDIRGY